MYEASMETQSSYSMKYTAEASSREEVAKSPMLRPEAQHGSGGIRDPEALTIAACHPLPPFTKGASAAGKAGKACTLGR